MRHLKPFLTLVVLMTALLGGVTVTAEGEERDAAALASIDSVEQRRILFALLELYGTGAWLFQVRGVLTLLKVGLVGLAASWPAARVPLLLAAIALGSVGSHMPARYRHHTLFAGTQARHRRG